MAGTTPTQSLRFGQLSDVISDTMVKNLADDIAVQLDAADVARTAALKRPCAVILDTTTSVPVGGVPTTVSFDTEVYDPFGMIDIATQPTRITVSAAAGAGLYRIQVLGNAGTASTWTTLEVTIMKNGGINLRRKFNRNANVTATRFGLAGIVWLGAVADFVTLQLYHDGGGTAAVTGIEMRAQKITSN